MANQTRRHAFQRTDTGEIFTYDAPRGVDREMARLLASQRVGVDASLLRRVGLAAAR